ncbi:fungal specific transcription factor domain-containing [Trichoderma arundinaceum]|uniref:Fungal specific transcription factor domain-containing n=1 Tax=Trichoderma arundinaceum TaxID=490622 RepID=A0A395NTU3_TRIAR|nr:fungal specific transcription factor domain-containing [Trichoderma arundinaceum]
MDDNHVGVVQREECARNAAFVSLAVPLSWPQHSQAHCQRYQIHVAQRSKPEHEMALRFPHLSRLIKDDRGTFMFIGDSANHSFLQNIRRIVRKHVGDCIFVDDPLRHYMVEACPSKGHNFLDHGTVSPPKPTEDEARSFVHWYRQATHSILHLFDDTKICDDILNWLRLPQEPLGAISATYSLILAIGAQACPADYDETAERHFNYGRYVTLATLMDDPSIATTQCHVLIAMYLLAQSRRNAAFMYLGIAVRGAYALGLHREDVSALYDSTEYMTRERLWKGVRTLDLFMSASLGRPPATLETRDTASKEHYSAMNDLSYIFENILTEVYAKRMITTECLKKISELHRGWATRFGDGLRVDNIPLLEEMQIETGSTPNIGLIHLKEAYYWTIMLLSRPFLIDYVSSSSIPGQTDSSSKSCQHDTSTLSPSRNILAQACVDSAVRTIDLFQPLLTGKLTPKRLPFVVNSAFAASLIIGLALFSDLDGSMALRRKRLGDACKILEKFSTHDPVTKRYLGIVEKLISACDTFIELQQQKSMEYNNDLIGRLFGRVDGDVQIAEYTSVNAGEMAQWQSIWESESAELSQPTPATMGSVTMINSNTENERMEQLGCGDVHGRNTMMQQDGCDNPSLQNQSLVGDIGSFLSPRTLWFDSYDNSSLFPTVGSNMLEFASLEGDHNTA